MPIIRTFVKDYNGKHVRTVEEIHGPAFHEAKGLDQRAIETRGSLLNLNPLTQKPLYQQGRTPELIIPKGYYMIRT